MTTTERRAQRQQEMSRKPLQPCKWIFSIGVRPLVVVPAPVIDFHPLVSVLKSCRRRQAGLSIWGLPNSVKKPQRAFPTIRGGIPEFTAIEYRLVARTDKSADASLKK